MRILFMGTPDFAVPSLQALLEAKYTIVGVVTQPDKPKGRGKQLAPSPIKQLAETIGYPVYTPVSIRQDPYFIEQIKTLLEPELIVVVAFGQILPPALLNIPKYGCINVHSSLLPKYRGAAPSAWAIINGETDTGVTTMFLNEKMDEGDIIFQDKIPIDSTDTRGTLESKLSKLGASLLIKTIQAIENGTAPRTPQNNAQATYAPKVTTEHGKINWSKSAVEISNLIRGLHPDPGAFTFYKGRRIRIIESNVGNLSTTNKASGTIISIEKGNKPGIYVSTGQDILILKSVQPEGKKTMSALDFANGYRVEIGHQFTSEL